MDSDLVFVREENDGCVSYTVFTKSDRKLIGTIGYNRSVDAFFVTGNLNKKKTEDLGENSRTLVFDPYN